MAKTRDTDGPASAPASTYGVPPPGFLTAADAAERLGISVRHFKKRIASEPITGTISQGDGPTARKLYPESVVDGMIIESAEEETHSAIASIMKQAALATVEIHKAAQLAIDAGVSAIQGTDPRTLSLLEELTRLRAHVSTLEQNALGFWELMKEMQSAHASEMRAQLMRERERMLESVRQEGLSRAFELALPGIIHRLAPSKETEKSILAKAIEYLPAAVREDVMPKILGNIPGELASSLHALIQEALEDEAKRQAVKQKTAAAEPTPAAAAS